jgi:hypothetical protein
MSRISTGLLGFRYSIQKHSLHRLPLPDYISNDRSWTESCQFERIEHIPTSHFVPFDHAWKRDID